MESPQAWSSEEPRKKRGYVTHDQINSLMKEVNSEQIENVLAMLSKMGINVIESDEAETEEAREEPEGEESEGEVARTTPAETKKSVPGEPLVTRSRHRLCAAAIGTAPALPVSSPD